MSNLNDLENTISSKLVEYRKANKLTQSEVGEKINYSDKTVSKWERGENMPEVSALFSLSKLYKCKITDFFGEKPVQEKNEHNKNLTVYQRISVSLMSTLGLWFLAIMAYMFATSFRTDINTQWLIFIYTIPLTFLMLTIFNCIWGKTAFLPWIISLTVWGTALSLYLTLDFTNKWLLFIVVGVLQLIACIWYSLILHNNKKKNDNILNK